DDAHGRLFLRRRARSRFRIDVGHVRRIQVIRMRTIEISVGAFLLAGIIALIFIAVRVSGVNLSRTTGTYSLTARFHDVAGLRVRSKVSMAGVTIGRVAKIDVDSEYGEAIVTFEISDKINNLASDCGAQIQTEGILGGRYVNISQGADDKVLKDGDRIRETQDAVVLENLIGQLLTVNSRTRNSGRDRDKGGQ